MNEDLYMMMDLYGADSLFSYQTVWCVTIEDVDKLPDAGAYQTELATSEVDWTASEFDPAGSTESDTVESD